MKSPCRDCKESKPPECRKDCKILASYVWPTPGPGTVGPGIAQGFRKAAAI
jgi:hypothetical protein